jgi:DNA segregation ATPase FtsK/SpoIIIE-like protein
MFEGQPTGEDDPDSQLYRKAVQTVAESGKASTSYIQRQLRIGYNNAARLIERMEKEGKVSAPDHVGPPRGADRRRGPRRSRLNGKEPPGSVAIQGPIPISPAH